MKQAINPILFLLANNPAAEQNLEAVMSILQFTNEAVKNIKNSLDNFHETILKMKDQTPHNNNR
ncbi:MAG: hypothetical protein PHT62_09365 [Desulfotomaculaceae bacterium]|nr:hypothetical protein [Desulfotomaculaceae bacterium]